MSKIVTVTLKLNVLDDHWLRFKERIPNYTERLEQFINDSGANIDDSMGGEELPEKETLYLFGESEK